MADNHTPNNSETTFTDDLFSSDLTGTLSSKDLTGSTLSTEFTGSMVSDGYLSFMNDETARNWNRELFTPDMGLGMSGSQETKEMVDLLWKSGDPESIPETPAEESQEMPEDDESGTAPQYNTYGTTRTETRKSDGRYDRNYSRNAANATTRSTASAGPRTDARQTRTYARTSRKPKKGILSRLIVIIMVLVILNFGLAALFIVMRRADVQIPGIENSIDLTNDYKNNYPDDVDLSVYGYDYSDFYTPKYIASYYLGNAVSMHKYQELCVIDVESYIGTSRDPVYPGSYMWNNSTNTWYSMAYNLDDSYLNCGFSVRYADTSPQYITFLPDSMNPPDTANREDFFRTIEEMLSDPPDYYDNNYNDCEFSEVKKIHLDDHDIEYMEITYTDSAGNRILDVISFEKKPLSSAFITEYRCEEGEITDGEEAIERVYGLLTFHVDGFEYLSASNRLFSCTRVFNGDNSYSAKVDISRLKDLRSSTMYSKGQVSFGLGSFGENDDYTCMINAEFRDYSTVDYYGGPEEWAAAMLAEESKYGEYPTEIPEENISQFTFNRRDVYYLTFDGIETYNGENEDVRHHKYRIEVPEAGEVLVDIICLHDIPETFDEKQFLINYVKLEDWTQ